MIERQILSYLTAGKHVCGALAETVFKAQWPQTSCSITAISILLSSARDSFKMQIIQPFYCPCIMLKT